MDKLNRVMKYLLDHILQSFYGKIVVVLYRVPIILVIIRTNKTQNYGTIIIISLNFSSVREQNLTMWLQNFFVSGLIPITELPVKTNSGFQGRRMNLITIVHLVVIS